MFTIEAVYGILVEYPTVRVDAFSTRQVVPHSPEHDWNNKRAYGHCVAQPIKLEFYPAEDLYKYT